MGMAMIKTWWRGVEGVEIIWNGQWCDPEVLYNGVRANCFVVENTMWARYKDLARSEGYTEDELEELGELAFSRYCQDHAEEVYELIIMFSKEN